MSVPQQQLVSLNIASPSDPAMTGGLGALESAECLAVCDQDSYEMAGAEVRRIAGVVKRLEDLRLSITRPMDEAKQRVMDLFRGPTAQYEQARATIEGKMLSHRRAEEKARAEREAEQRRLAAEEESRRQAALLEQAQAAEAAGDAERAQAALDAAAAPPPPPPVAPMAEAPKAAGTSVRKLWKAECTDLDALIKAAAAGNQLARSVLICDTKALGAQARALQNRLVIPGVRVWPEDSLAARA